MHVKPEVRTELQPSQKTLIESLDKLHVDHTHVPINDTVEKKKSSWWSNLLYSGRNEKPRASSKEPSLPESKKQKQLETNHSSSNLQAITETKKDDAFHGLKKKKSAAPTKKLSSYGKNYEPYKAEPKPSTNIVDAVVNKVAPKISKEDQDRNNRHSMVVNLLNGTTKLSDYFTSKYKIGEVLGDGAFGFVLTAIQIEDNIPVAIKFIIKSRVPKDLWNKETNLPAEIHILSKLRHPNIIRYIEHIDERDFILLVTELFGTEWDSSNPKLSPEKNLGLRNAKKKSNVALSEKSDCSPLFRLTEEQEKSIRRKTSFDLFECIDAHKQLPEPVVKKIMGQIALAINYMHQKNIVHRDIKDENVVIDENYNVKLVDFGSASIIPTRKEKYFTKFNGTTHFASPEVSKGMSYRGPEAEAWSLGVLFFTIICGENPFQNRNEIIKGEFTYPFKIKDDCKNLIDRLLEINEKNRATIEDVLNHPYLKSEVALLIKKYRG